MTILTNVASGSHQSSTLKIFMMPKDWNAAYENDITPWDKGFAAPPLSEFLETHLITGQVLVPGAGTGHDVRLLAKQGAQVVGLDISARAVRKAEGFDRVNQERFEVGDFLELPTQFHGQFDYVVEHTCLCALDPEQRAAYALSVKRALRAGGHYLAVFYRVVKDYDKDGPPHPISTEQIEALFGADFEMLKIIVPLHSYPGRSFGSEEVRFMRLKS
jgi:hypothetical protein